jgi:hypothetical protein
MAESSNCADPHINDDLPSGVRHNVTVHQFSSSTGTVKRCGGQTLAGRCLKLWGGGERQNGRDGGSEEGRVESAALYLRRGCGSASPRWTAGVFEKNHGGSDGGRAENLLTGVCWC